jgi:hypothetical protein
MNSTRRLLLFLLPVTGTLLFLLPVTGTLLSAPSLATAVAAGLARGLAAAAQQHNG